jgi:preprotein translocase subunit YajC
VMMGIFYFMLIRPQKKRAQHHRDLVESLDEGDEVVTIGGLYGRVRRIGDQEVDLEVAPGTVLRFLKSAVARKLTEDAGTTTEEEGTTTEEEGA